LTTPKGRAAAAQPRPQARPGRARRCRQHPRRSRRDVDCQSTEGESRMAELLDHPLAADTIWFVRPSRYASAFSARDKFETGSCPHKVLGSDLVNFRESL
jgi:hypothetical protein